MTSLFIFQNVRSYHGIEEIRQPVSLQSHYQDKIVNIAPKSNIKTVNHRTKRTAR